MGHVMYCYTCCIFYRASRIEETLSDFLLNYGSREMRHDGVASGYPTPTGFHRLMGYQRDPRDRGITAWYQIIGTRVHKD